MSYKTAIGMLLLLGSGCSNIPKFELPERLSIPWLSRAPSQGSIGVLSIIEESSESKSAPPEPTTWDAKKGAGVGAVTGSLGGTALGLATCAPFLGGPPLYVACAAGGMAIGFLGGMLAGGVIGDTAQRRMAWHSEVEGVIAALPDNSELAGRFHRLFIERTRPVTTRQVIDVGTVAPSQLAARQATSPTKDILILRSMDVSAEQVGSKAFRVVVSVHAELNSEGWLNYLKRTKYSYEGAPISQEARYDEKFAAATKAVDDALSEIADKISKAYFPSH